MAERCHGICKSSTCPRYRTRTRTGSRGGGQTSETGQSLSEDVAREGRVSRGVHVEIYVLGLAQKVVYLLHRAERTHLLLGALGHDPSRCARRFPRSGVHDVRVTVRVDRARPVRGRTKQRARLALFRLRPIEAHRRIVPRGLRIGVFEIDVRVPFRIDGRPPAVRHLLPRGHDSLSGGRLRPTDRGLEGTTVQGWMILELGPMSGRDGKTGVYRSGAGVGQVGVVGLDGGDGARDSGDGGRRGRQRVVVAGGDQGVLIGQ